MDFEAILVVRRLSNLFSTTGKIAFDSKQTILSLFIDFKKAFDLVDQRLLWLKLFHYGFSNSSLDLISNYFLNRSQITRIDKAYSSKSPIKLGVPQGSILGPLFFLIFINDMAFVNDLSLVLFADDTTFYAADVNYDSLLAGFRAKFDELYNWMRHNKLTVNWSKTKFMLINANHTHKPKSIDIARNSVEVVTEFKLLGCHIDDKLLLGSHVNKLKNTVNKKLYSIKSLFFLSFDIKLQFFKTFILPHFDFCNSILIFLSNNLINKLSSFYNTCVYVLLKIKLRHLTVSEQQMQLSLFNLFPFKYRLFYRFSIFSYKIMNGIILKNILTNKFCSNKHGLRDAS